MKLGKRNARLRAIADQLEKLHAREAALFAERLDLWREGSAEGLKSHDLAAPSRVRPVTVRNLLGRCDK